MYKLGIVGSGPAAFYTAQKLLKSSKNICIDMYEKLPVPFGLVRYGVAPDHPEVKNVINTFSQVCLNERFRYFGNVNIGTDLSLAEMRRNYHGVLLAYGAAVDRKLQIHGEELKGVYSASEIVGWYNGLPEFENFQPNMQCEEAIIIGQGNVALDISRILLTPIDLLKKTDIPDKVLDQLSSSKIKSVKIIGRRGPLQVSFTIKELRELLRIPQSQTVINLPLEFDLSPDKIEKLARPRRRLTQLLLDHYSNGHQSACESFDKICTIDFLKSPVEIISDKHNQSMSCIKFQINRMQGESVEATSGIELVNCKMLVRSIGYKSLQIDKDLPFNSQRNIIPNDRGRVVTATSESDDADKGLATLYCVGWIKRGPVGVILTTLNDAQETSAVILEDLAVPFDSQSSKLDMAQYLTEKNVKYLTFSNWEAINRIEVELGQQKGKPREKLTNLHELMLAATKS